MDNDIERVTNELEALDLEQSRIERRRTRLRNTLTRLREEEQRRRRLSYLPLDDVRNRVDRDGTRLARFDRITFLTQGVVRHTELGWIETFGKRYANCRDDDGFAIQREPKNLRKVPPLTPEEARAARQPRPEPTAEEHERSVQRGIRQYAIAAEQARRERLRRESESGKSN